MTRPGESFVTAVDRELRHICGTALRHLPYAGFDFEWMYDRGLGPFSAAMEFLDCCGLMAYANDDDFEMWRLIST